MSFSFESTNIKEVKIITPKVFVDERGFFFESYKASLFKLNDMPDDFVQNNHSKSTKGVLRGLHYQLNPKAQSKLVRCIRGAIFDVAVDIRKNSPTFAKWVGVELSGENKKMLYIPKGFAHGFYVLSDEAEVCYQCSEEYSPELDAGILWNDPEIGIDWSNNITGTPPVPIISEKDRNNPLLKDAKNNFQISY